MPVTAKFARSTVKKQLRCQWTPAAAAVTETTNLFAVPAGWRVLRVSGNLITASDQAGTVAVGDAGSANRYVLTTDKAANGAPGRFQGNGTGQNLGGFLNTAATNVRVVYTAAGTELIAPVYEFRCEIEREFP